MLTLNKISRTILLFLFILIISCSQKNEEFIVKKSSIIESVYASGTIKSKGQYILYPKVSGILQVVNVTEGQKIDKKQILFAIENENSIISKKNAKLLKDFNSINNQNDKLDDIEYQLGISKNKLYNDSINFNRQKSLWLKKIISDAEYEQVDLNYKNSKTQVLSLQSKYYELKKQLQFYDKQSSNSFQLSEANESDFFIKSNVSGCVFEIYRNEGEFVSPQTPLAVIGSDKNFYIEIQIDEKDISKISLNQILDVKLDCYPNSVFEAKISKIIPFLNEKTKTINVEAEFTKAPKKLYPNLSLEANIIINKKNNAYVIPFNYISNKNEVILKNGKKKKVSTGLKNFNFVEITSGLKENEIILSQE